MKMTDDAHIPRDWLDDLFAAESGDGHSAYIADEGFTARVMDLLPGRVTLPAWRGPAVLALWGIALAGIALALPGAALDVMREGYKLLATQPVSLSGIAGALLCAGALSWSAAAYALRTSD
jgi:hypothetical protein